MDSNFTREEFTPSDPQADVSVVRIDGGESRIQVPGGEELLSADFSREGFDLILDGGAAGAVIVPDYFSTDTPPDLAFGASAHLKAATVGRLAGPMAPAQYAQTQDTQGDAVQAGALGAPIGSVTELEGVVTATRANGVQVTLNTGDPIYQGDVVETGAKGSVGVVFADDTTFSLDESGTMVMDEMVYDPDTQAGAFQTTVVKGVFSFVSGQTAKTDPDAMVINTPKTTIGIRGSTGLVRAGENVEDQITLIPDIDGNIGELIVSNQGGAQVLNLPNASTTVFSALQPPAPVRIMSPQEIQQNFGASLTTLVRTEARKATVKAQKAVEQRQQAEAEAQAQQGEADQAEAEADAEAQAAAEAEAAAAEAAAEAEAAKAEAEAARLEAEALADEEAKAEAEAKLAEAEAKAAAAEAKAQAEAEAAAQAEAQAAAKAAEAAAKAEAAALAQQQAAEAAAQEAAAQQFSQMAGSAAQVQEQIFTQFVETGVVDPTLVPGAPQPNDGPQGGDGEPQPGDNPDDGDPNAGDEAAQQAFEEAMAAGATPDEAFEAAALAATDGNLDDPAVDAARAAYEEALASGATPEEAMLAAQQAAEQFSFEQQQAQFDPNAPQDGQFIDEQFNPDGPQSGDPNDTQFSSADDPNAPTGDPNAPQGDGQIEDLARAAYEDALASGLSPAEAELAAQTAVSSFISDNPSLAESFDPNFAPPPGSFDPAQTGTFDPNQPGTFDGGTQFTSDPYSSDPFNTDPFNTNPYNTGFNDPYYDPAFDPYYDPAQDPYFDPSFDPYYDPYYASGDLYGGGLYYDPYYDPYFDPYAYDVYFDYYGDDPYHNDDDPYYDPNTTSVFDEHFAATTGNDTLTGTSVNTNFYFAYSALGGTDTITDVGGQNQISFDSLDNVMVKLSSVSATSGTFYVRTGAGNFATADFSGATQVNTIDFSGVTQYLFSDQSISAGYSADYAAIDAANATEVVDTGDVLVFESLEAGETGYVIAGTSGGDTINLDHTMVSGMLVFGKDGGDTFNISTYGTYETNNASPDDNTVDAMDHLVIGGYAATENQDLVGSDGIPDADLNVFSYASMDFTAFTLDNVYVSGTLQNGIQLNDGSGGLDVHLEGAPTEVGGDAFISEHLTASNVNYEHQYSRLNDMLWDVGSFIGSVDDDMIYATGGAFQLVNGAGGDDTIKISGTTKIATVYGGVGADTVQIDADILANKTLSDSTIGGVTTKIYGGKSDNTTDAFNDTFSVLFNSSGSISDTEITGLVSGFENWAVQNSSYAEGGTITFDGSQLAGRFVSFSGTSATTTDTLTLNGLQLGVATGASLLGGAGADTLNVTIDSATDSTSFTVTVTSFEDINYSVTAAANGLAVALDFTGFTNATTLDYDSSAASANETISVTTSAITSDSYTMNAGGQTTSDVLNLVGGGTIAQAQMANITGFEVINLGSDAAYSITLADVSQNLTINAASVTTATNSVAINGSGVTTGTSVLTITGGAGSDNLIGGAAGDTITSNGGDDIIRGLAGNDTLVGDTGVDTFVFESTAAVNGQDTITGFTAGTDKIDLSAFDTFGNLSSSNLSGATETLTAGKVYYLFSQAAGVAENAASSLVTALNAATLTDSAAVTSMLVVSDDNSTSVYEWVSDGGSNEATGDTFTLMATLDDVLTAPSDIIV